MGVSVMTGTTLEYVGERVDDVALDRSIALANMTNVALSPSPWVGTTKYKSARCGRSTVRVPPDGWARCDPVLLGLSPAIREEACEPGVVCRLGAATDWAAGR